MNVQQPVEQEAVTQRDFRTTHWSVVLAAADDKSRAADEALETLCQAYWYPLYAYVRRKGHSPEDAKDLTQEFFARVLARGTLGAADRARGRFRSFLLGTLEHFLAREWARNHRQKRGGGHALLSLDDTAEDRYRIEPSHDLTPERIFERRYALALLERTLSRLREECESEGKGALFDQLKGTLAGEAAEKPHARIAEALGLTEGAVRVAAHRLRKRYGELLRDEVGQTVSMPLEVEDEIRWLLTALRS